MTEKAQRRIEGLAHECIGSGEHIDFGTFVQTQQRLEDQPYAGIERGAG